MRCEVIQTSIKNDWSEIVSNNTRSFQDSCIAAHSSVEDFDKVLLQPGDPQGFTKVPIHTLRRLDRSCCFCGGCETFTSAEILLLDVSPKPTLRVPDIFVRPTFGIVSMSSVSVNR